MTKIVKVSSKKKIKVNIIPLIDIIFLMLVFFMLATKNLKNGWIWDLGQDFMDWSWQFLLRIKIFVVR